MILGELNKMLTVTVKFVVESEKEANSLMDEISQDIGNDYGVPYIFSDVSTSSLPEIETYKEMMREIEIPESR